MQIGHRLGGIFVPAFASCKSSLAVLATLLVGARSAPPPRTLRASGWLRPAPPLPSLRSGSLRCRQSARLRGQTKSAFCMVAAPREVIVRRV